MRARALPLLIRGAVGSFTVFLYVRSCARDACAAWFSAHAAVAKSSLLAQRRIPLPVTAEWSAHAAGVMDAVMVALASAGLAERRIPFAVIVTAVERHGKNRVRPVKHAIAPVCRGKLARSLYVRRFRLRSRVLLGVSLLTKLPATFAQHGITGPSGALA